MTYRPLHVIAREIRADWSKAKGGINYAAKPYLEALSDCGDITGRYGEDSTKSVVLYFLSNATTWRGETARRIKAELKAMAAGKPVPPSVPVQSAHMTAGPRDTFTTQGAENKGRDNPTSPNPYPAGTGDARAFDHGQAIARNAEQRADPAGQLFADGRHDRGWPHGPAADTSAQGLCASDPENDPTCILCADGTEPGHDH